MSKEGQWVYGTCLSVQFFSKLKTAPKIKSINLKFATPSFSKPKVLWRASWLPQMGSRKTTTCFWIFGAPRGSRTNISLTLEIKKIWICGIQSEPEREVPQNTSKKIFFSFIHSMNLYWSSTDLRIEDTAVNKFLAIMGLIL